MAEKEEEWELMKENIQPLRQGRVMTSLETALESNNDSLLQQQKKYEEVIESYLGDDPLGIWSPYIQWIEQHYPAGGREGNLFKSVHKCCVLFAKDERYTNDPRYLEIWLKGINLCAEPLDLYNFMYVNNICCQLAAFYINWAMELENGGDNKRADKIYVEGIQRRAEPLHLLEISHRKFFTRLSGTITENLDTEFESEREVLTVLKPGKKNRVLNNRFDCGLRVSSAVEALKDIKLASNSRDGCHIFEDINPRTEILAGNGEGIDLASIAESGKENVQNPQKWTGAKMKQKTVKALSIAAALQDRFLEFEIHNDDPKPEEKKYEPVPENDPKIKIMYFKEKLFTATEEFQFEELRCFRWKATNAKYNIVKDELKTINPESLGYKSTDQTDENLNCLRNRAVDAGTNRNGSTKCSRSAFQLIKNNPDTDSSADQLVTRDTSDKCITPEKQKMPVFENIENTEPHYSPTINTKLALNTVMDLYNKTLGLNDGATTDEMTSQTEEVPYSIFEVKVELAQPVLPEVNFFEDKNEILANKENDCCLESSVKLIDPFDGEVKRQILERLPQSVTTFPGVKIIDSNLPAIKSGITCTIGSRQYEISTKFIGGFANLFKAIDESGEVSVLKIQQPPSLWEIYITEEVFRRLESEKKFEVMNGISRFNSSYVYNDGSILVSKFSNYGTLLNAINVCKQQGTVDAVPEVIAVYFAIELLVIVEGLHKCKIIHGDIKPDNVIVDNLEELSVNEYARQFNDVHKNKICALKLIDFGEGIDMTKFPPGTTFNEKISTDGFVCPQMMDNAPWSYEIDYFGVLATIHCMLFGKYLTIKKEGNVWKQDKPFKRYWQSELWERFYKEWLNIPNSETLPDLMYWKEEFMKAFVVCARKKGLKLSIHSLKSRIYEQSNR